MKQFIIEQSKKEFYTSQSGLAIVGAAINQFANLGSTLKRIITSSQAVINNIDVVKTYLGLLCQAKSDFEAAKAYKEDDFFKDAMGIEQIPSVETLRQRFDQNAELFDQAIDEASIDFLANAKVPVSTISTGHAPLDMDVFPMDNSGTKKEGVLRTYKGYFGYAPIAAYLGTEGWCLTCELREGSKHSQKDFHLVLDRVLPRARKLTDKPLLLRLDSGHDALDNLIKLSGEEKTDYLIKWNPRQQSHANWLFYCDKHDVKWKEPREGKRVSLFSVFEEYKIKGKSYTFRRVMRITERSITSKGQIVMPPEITLEGWWTSLDCSDEEVIQLYKEHATSEQFHSEFKTDLDLERLPSGKFKTNAAILTMGAFAYNILRFVGLEAMTQGWIPRHPVKRRRIRTIIQELIYLAARIVSTGRRLKLRFSRHCFVFPAIEHLYRKLSLI